MISKSKIPVTSRLFAGSMWSHFNFGDPNDRYKAFLADGKIRFSHLIDGLLMYDEVVIPTQDFMAVALLIGALGQRWVIDALESDCLSFLRVKGGFSYGGGGAGFFSYVIDKKEGGSPAFCADTEYALDWALSGPNVEKIDPRIRALILGSTPEIKVKDILESVKKETYNDILEYEELRKLFGLRNDDLNKLKGIKPGGIRIFGGLRTNSWIGDEIDILLAVAQSNVEMVLATMNQSTDSTTANPVGHTLKSKISRMAETPDFDRYITLMKIESVPDLANTLFDLKIDERDKLLQKIVKIRNTNSGKEFRQWFHKECRHVRNPLELQAKYNDVLRDSLKGLSLVPKSIRFAIVSGLSAILNPLVGLLVAAGDTFVLDHWIRPVSPANFIYNLKSELKKAEKKK